MFVVFWNPKAVSRANGIKTLMNILLDTARYASFSESITNTIIYCIDDKETRQYFRPGYDMQPVIAPFAQLAGKDSTLLISQLEASKRVICRIMRGWTGLIMLSHDGASFKSIIQSLMIGDEPKRIDIILDMFATILTNASPEEFRDLLPKPKDPPREPMQQNWRRFSINVKRQPSTGTTTSGQFQESITRTFFACTVLSLIKNGLVDVLHDLSEKGTNERAAKLFQVMLVLADKFLSSQLCLDIHDQFDKEYSDEMNQIPLSGRHQIKKTLSILNTFYLQSKTFFKHKTVKTKVDTVMDDLLFQNNIKNSNVLNRVPYSQWDWNCISTLIYGPFKLPLRLAEVLNTKSTSDFCKEILDFYKPFKKGAFCDLGIQEGIMYTDLCCQLMEDLLALPEGIALLKHSGFIKQLYESMEIELGNNPEAKKDRVFSEIAVTRTLAREYFKEVKLFNFSSIIWIFHLPIQR
jgi:hypothetical protein